MFAFVAVGALDDLACGSGWTPCDCTFAIAFASGGDATFGPSVVDMVPTTLLSKQDPPDCLGRYVVVTYRVNV